MICPSCSECKIQRLFRHIFCRIPRFQIGSSARMCSYGPVALGNVRSSARLRREAWRCCQPRSNGAGLWASSRLCVARASGLRSWLPAFLRVFGGASALRCSSSYWAFRAWLRGIGLSALPMPLHLASLREISTPPVRIIYALFGPSIAAAVAMPVDHGMIWATFAISSALAVLLWGLVGATVGTASGLIGRAMARRRRPMVVTRG